MAKTASDFAILETTLHVTYMSTDITLDINKDLLSFSYTDNCNDESDNFRLTLKDETGKWAGTWSPTRGEKIDAFITTDFRGSLIPGIMVVDTLRTSGSPRVFEINAVSIPLDNTIRRTPKTRNFEKINLSKIAEQIAQENDLEFMYDCQENPEYDRIDQRQESDLSFLKRLCEDAGLSVKVSSEMLIIFDQLFYEKKESVCSYVLGRHGVLSWSFTAQQSERYRACTVKWRNVKKKTKSTATTVNALADQPTIDDPAINDWWLNYTGQKKNSKTKIKKGSQKKSVEYIDYTYVDETVDESGQIYVIKKRCNSLQEAERIAKAKLRQLNLRQTSGNLTVVGNPLLMAGECIDLQGFGSFDGKFFIEQAEHTIGSGGYTTSLQIRRVNEKY